MMIEYYKNDCIHLFFDEENSLAIAVWNGFLSSQMYRDSMTRCLNLIHEKQVKCLLSDNRKMKAIRQQDQRWAIDEWSPKLAQTTLLKMATLQSEDIFNQMAINSIMEKAAHLFPFQNQFFSQEQAALDWLRQEVQQKEKEEEQLPRPEKSMEMGE